jgi:hypothetical protein
MYRPVGNIGHTRISSLSASFLSPYDFLNFICVRGSYSYSTPLSEEQGLGPDTLLEPLEDEDRVPRVLFAGEATSRFLEANIIFETLKCSKFGYGP